MVIFIFLSSCVTAPDSEPSEPDNAEMFEEKEDVKISEENAADLKQEAPALIETKAEDSKVPEEETIESASTEEAAAEEKTSDEEPPVSETSQEKDSLENRTEAESETAEEKTEISTEEETVAEEETQPFEVSEEMYQETFENIEVIIEELNQIIKNKDFDAWQTYLTDEYIEQTSKSEYLARWLKDSRLQKENIVLRSIRDYFDYVVVPRRFAAKLHEIEFLDDNVLLGHCAGDRKNNNGLAVTQITRLNNEWIYKYPVPNPFVELDKKGTVELDCELQDAAIYYTLDRTLPTQNSKRYDGPFTVSKTTPLLFLATKDGEIPSSIVYATIGKDVFQPAQTLKDPQGGIHFSYYEGEFSSVQDIENMTPKFSGVESHFSIDKRKVEEDFAYSFDGFIKVRLDGIYTFYLLSNDGSTLDLNDDILIDNDGGHGANEMFATIALKSGFHKFKVLYFQQGGGKAFTVSWQGPGFEKHEIPPDALFIDIN